MIQLRSVLAISILLAAALLLTPNPAAQAQMSEPCITLVDGNTAFALDLYRELKSGKGNLFFSPYSITTTLAMTYAGARGETARQMEKTLHCHLGRDQHYATFYWLVSWISNIQSKGGIQLLISSSLFPQSSYPFLPAFDSLMIPFDVSVTPVDYAKDPAEAIKTINETVEIATALKFKDLVNESDLTPSTTLILVNAVYFKDDWESQFKPDQTREADFTLPNGKSAKVPMMHQTGKFGYKEIGNMQILKLPYAGKSLSMIAFLPRTTEGLSRIEDRLTTDNLRRWLSRLIPQPVHVAFPKFRIEWGMKDLKAALEALGMKNAFVRRKADFSGMDGTKNLFISAVLHKAFVDVNEAGTEAAASAAVIMPRPLAPIPDFRADHPFLFLIRDNWTGSILFLGRVTNPVAK